MAFCVRGSKLPKENREKTILTKNFKQMLSAMAQGAPKTPTKLTKMTKVLIDFDEN